MRLILWNFFTRTIGRNFPSSGASFTLAKFHELLYFYIRVRKSFAILLQGLDLRNIIWNFRDTWNWMDQLFANVALRHHVEWSIKIQCCESFTRYEAVSQLCTFSEHFHELHQCRANFVRRTKSWENSCGASCYWNIFLSAHLTCKIVVVFLYFHIISIFRHFSCRTKVFARRIVCPTRNFINLQSLMHEMKHLPISS